MPSCAGQSPLVSEVRTRGAGGASDEFIELFNPTASAITLDAVWKLEKRSNASASYAAVWLGTGKVIPARGHYLVAGAAYVQAPAADDPLVGSLTDATSIRLMNQGVVQDSLCLGYDAASDIPFTSDTTYSCRGLPATNPHNNSATTDTDSSLERKPGGVLGNCRDSGDNAADFQVLAPANPQSTLSPPTP